MSKVEYIADALNDNSRITPAQVLQDAIADIESGKRNPNKLVVFMLEDGDDKYHTNFYASNLRISELLALCSRWLYNFNNWMNE